MKIKINDKKNLNKFLFIIGARTNTPLTQVKEIYNKRFEGDADKNLSQATKLYYTEQFINNLKK